MENIENIEKTNIDSEQEIDLKDIIKQLWRSRRFIFTVVVISLFIGVFVALTSPVSYMASTTIVPQTGGQDGLGRLAGFTNIMGVNLGGAAMTGEVLSPAIYPRIVQSVPFTKEIMTTPIVVARSNGVPITLYEYYTNAKYRPRNILAGIKRYTIGLPGVILSALRSNNNDDDVIYRDGDTGEIISLTRSEREVIEIIRGNMRIEHNVRDGYVILGYTFGEPEAVAVITQQMFRTLERYITDFMLHRQMENLQFVELSYEDARAEFLQSHANLAAFLDANRGLTTVAARTQERLLSNEYELAVAVYRELARQREQTRLAVKESTPVLTVIEPVVVPQERSAPRRSLILAVFLFLGVTVGIGWVLVKPFFRDIVKEVREGK
jgi:uncharacterized protein involved in exopolysaccharide biosynthesis